MIETQRLILRTPTLADAVAMQAIKEANWTEIQKWMNWAYDDQLPMAATQNFIGNIVPADQERGGDMLFAFHKITGDLVMVGGLNATDEPYVFGTGYWGNVDYLGQGYVTEMTLGTLQFAFNEKNATKVVIAYYDDNIASKRVIEKCGFKFVETKPKAHARCLDGTLMDEHMFAMTRDQWQRRRTP